MRRTIAGLLLLVCAACSSERTATSPTPNTTPSLPPATTAVPSPRPSPDLGLFAVAGAMEHVRALAVEIGIRMSGTEGDDLAADYISRTMNGLGLRTERRAFPLPQGGESWNVVGLPPSFDETKPYLLIGGHYDSLNGPGANDNATGIGVMLEVARAIKARPAAYPVAFVAFGAEERQPTPDRPHHVGSRHYVAQMSQAARSNLVAMVNVDMVGHGDEITCGRMDAGPRDGTNRCLEHGRALGIPVKERVTPDWSDNGTFLRAGMNAAWLWTGELECCYHNPRDTIDVVRTREVEWSGRLALAILRSFTR